MVKREKKSFENGNLSNFINTTITVHTVIGRLCEGEEECTFCTTAPIIPSLHSFCHFHIPQ